MLYWLSSYCKNGGIAHGLLHLHSVVVFCLYFVYCMIILFVDNLFFTWAASKASLAALRLYGYFCNFVSCYYRRINMMMMMP